MIAIGDNVIVQMEEKTKQIGSIIVPDTARERIVKGKVIAIGDKNPDNIKIGDTVLFNKLVKRREFEEDGKRYFKAKISDLDGILND